MPSVLLAMDNAEPRDQDAPKRHACHCGKSFLRKEHLRRHQASHAEPAFTCSVCNRSFTRSDLLRRHAALHDASAVPEFRRGRACDACHSNKTKCDGGVQCTLCTKRGVSCTYIRGATDLSSSSFSRQGRSAHVTPTSSAGSAAGDPPSDSGVPGPQGTVSPALSEFRSIPAPSNDSLIEPQANPALQVSIAGLQIVLKQVVTHRDSHASPASRPTSTPEVSAWLSSCVNSCFDVLLDRWPLMHGPSFQPTGQPMALIATMAIIGSWFKDSKSVRSLAVEVHNNLVQQLLEDILRVDLDVKAKWPFELYVAALLNVVFAIETGRDYLLPKARLLHGLVQTAIRGQGILNSEAIDFQVNKYYPGEFVPWKHTHREKFRRLVMGTFKADCYLSLLTGDAPTLRLEEINVGLVSTTAMWNAYGLDIFFRRWPCEPRDRSAYKSRDLSRVALSSFTPSVTLVEDIQHSLLAILPDVWTYSQNRQSHGGMAPNQSVVKEMMCDHLQVCQDHINRIVGLVATPGIQTQSGEALLGAYSCKEEPGHRNWKDNVKARIYSHVLTTTMLYHTLNLYVFADVPTLRNRFSSMLDLGTMGIHLAPPEQQTNVSIEQWVNSADGRIAVAHAVCCLGVYQQAVAVEEARGGTLDPILHSMLLSSAAVIWSWMTHSKDPCRCSPSMLQAELVQEDYYIQRKLELDSWVVSWTPLSLSTTPLCKCSLGIWMQRFADALSQGSKTWETNVPAMMGSMAF